MSRNLCTSKCCDNIVRLSDLRGKPIEFRQYYQYAPEIGCRWDCPTCKTAYFAIWRHNDSYWGLNSNIIDREEAIQFALTGEFHAPNGQIIKSENAGKYLIKREWQGKVQYEETGTFTIDLSFYESYNDEPGNKDEMQSPRHLCTDDAIETQVVW